MQPKPLVTLVDAHAMLYRLVHGRIATGAKTNYRTFSPWVLGRVLPGIISLTPPPLLAAGLATPTSPRGMIFCIDHGDTRARLQAVVPLYKRHRAEPSADVRAFLSWSLAYFNRMKDVSVVLPPHVAQWRGGDRTDIPAQASSYACEGDEIIATACDYYTKLGHPVLIVSTDKDLFQLINPERHIYFWHYTKRRFVDDQGVHSILGVDREQVVDLLTIQGDASDNIPGIPSFGKKRAVEVLKKYRTLEAVVAAAKDGTLSLKRLPKKALADVIKFEERARLIRDQAIVIRRLPEVEAELQMLALPWSTPDRFAQTFAAAWQDQPVVLPRK